MQKVDFTKTPGQVRREIESGLEDLARSLDASKGHKEKGTGALFHVVTILLVLVGNSAFAFLTPSNTKPSPPQVQSSLDARDTLAVANFLGKIESSSDSIEQIRNRVAPSMPIDGPLASVKTSVSGMRSILLSNAPESTKKK
jgi:hypothetical protein